MLETKKPFLVEDDELDEDDSDDEAEVGEGSEVGSEDSGKDEEEEW